MTDDKTRSSTEVYQHGYVAGYTQCRVDRGELSRKEADAIIKGSLE